MDCDFGLRHGELPGLIKHSKRITVLLKLGAYVNSPRLTIRKLIMADDMSLAEATQPLSFAEFLERMKNPAASDLVRHIKL